MKIYVLLETNSDEETKIKGIFRSREGAEANMEKLERKISNSIFYVFEDDLQ
jgi:hypothetical protein